MVSLCSGFVVSTKYREGKGSFSEDEEVSVPRDWCSHSRRDQVVLSSLHVFRRTPNDLPESIPLLVFNRGRSVEKLSYRVGV